MSTAPTLGQPTRVPIDLGRLEDSLTRETGARIRQGSNLHPAGAWRADLERRPGQGGRS